MSWLDRMLTAVTVLVLALTVYVWAGPRGPVGKHLQEWRARQRQSRLLDSLSGQLTAVGNTLPRNATLTRRGETIFEFSDYQCPFCRTSAPLLDQATRRGDLNVVIIHFPLSGHLQARPAALAAICAGDQGAFGEMNRYLMDTSDWMTDPDWETIAASLELDHKQDFLSCLRSDVTIERLEMGMAFGRALGVQGTPTFLSTSGTHTGVVTDSALASWSQRGDL